MKISIVVPVYNVEKYLRTCLDAILKQTIPAHEIIVVDDGSTDNSCNTCDAYANQYAQIKVVHKRNQGLGMARNTGLEHVSGDFVSFVDSDDFIEEKFIETVIKIISNTGCDSCRLSYKKVAENQNFLLAISHKQEIFKDKEIKNELIPRLIGSAPNRKDSIPVFACGAVFSTKIIQAHKIQFVSEREWISEDLVFNIEYYTYSQHCVLSDYIGYNYRTNPKSLTKTYTADRFEKCLAMYEKERCILIEKALYEKCKYRLDRQLFVFMKVCFKQLRQSQLTPKEKKMK